MADDPPDKSRRAPARHEADAPAPVESIRRNTAFALWTQLATASFTAVLTLYLVRALGPEGYGLLALALAISGLVGIPADLGLTHSVSRFVAETRSDRRRAARVVADGLVLKILVSAATSAVLFGAAGWIAAAYGEPSLAWPLRGVAVALFAQSVMTLVRGTFVALARISVNFRIVLTESAVETGATVALVLLGGGAAGAAFGRAVGYFVGAALGVALVAKTLGRESLAFRSFRFARAKGMARYAGALALVDGAFVLFGTIDGIVLGAFLGSAAVGIYAAPGRFVVFFQYPGLALANAVAPRLARSDGEEPAISTFVATIRYLLVFQAFLIPPLLVWARPITDLLLGAEYAESASVLRALTPFVFLSGVAPLVSLAANYMGGARLRVPVAFATVAVDVALLLVLVPWLGVVGAALASSVAYALYVPAHLWICRRLIDFPLGPIALTLGRSGLAAAAMGGVLALFGTSELGLHDWLLGGVTAACAYVAVLLLTREVRRSELLALLSAARRRRA